MPAKLHPGHVGDRIEVTAPGHELRRRGVIAEVLGAPGHERYRVRWLDGHDSIHYPTDGTRIRSRAPFAPVSHERLPDSPEGTRRWRVSLRDDVPLELELRAEDSGDLGLSDDELHQLLPTALERLSADGDHDIPFDEPVRLYANHFRG